MAYLYAFGKKHSQQQLKLESPKRAILPFNVLSLIPHNPFNTTLILRFFEKINYTLDIDIQKRTLYEVLDYFNFYISNEIKENINSFFNLESKDRSYYLLPESHYLQILFAVLKLDRRDKEEEIIIEYLEELELEEIGARKTEQEEKAKEEAKAKPLSETMFLSPRTLKKRGKEKTKRRDREIFEKVPKFHEIKEKDISLNRWAKFLQLFQKEKIKPKIIYRLYQKYPNPYLRRPEEVFEPSIPSLNSLESKLQRWYLSSPYFEFVTQEYEHLEKKKMEWGLYKNREKLCTRRMFFEHLFDPVENCILSKEAENQHLDLLNLDFPINQYWIDSSHNTYLIGDQLQSKSSIEQYRRALLRGCRCLEIDVWNAPDGSPIVYHGYTLTSRIPFADCMEAICQSAFVTSEYPVILSLEVHCSKKSRKKMAYIIQSLLSHPTYHSYFDNNVLGDMIYSTDRRKYTHDQFLLNKLKKKILIKASWKDFKETPQEDPAQISDPDSSEEDEEESEKKKILPENDPNLSSTDNEEKKKQLQKEFKNQGIRGLIQLAQLELQKRDDEEEEKKLHKRDKLYHNIFLENCVHITKSIDKTENPWNVRSIQEDKEEIHPKHGLNMLIRIYPKGGRVDSSNYNPLPYWYGGYQLVALNYQTNSIPMMLNEGKFMRAGRTGYIPKPPWMRTDGDYWKEEKESFILSGKLISGWQIPRPYATKEINLNQKISKPYVQIWKIDKDSNLEEIEKCLEKKNKFDGLLYETDHETVQNPYNPIWNMEFKFTVKVKEVEMLLFLVRDYRPKLDYPIIGYYAITIGDISFGFRVVPLKGDLGVPLLSGQLLVYIKMEKNDSNAEEPIKTIDKRKRDKKKSQNSQPKITEEDRELIFIEKKYSDDEKSNKKKKNLKDQKNKYSDSEDKYSEDKKTPENKYSDDEKATDNKKDQKNKYSDSEDKYSEDKKTPENKYSDSENKYSEDDKPPNNKDKKTTENKYSDDEKATDNISLLHSEDEENKYSDNEKTTENKYSDDDDKKNKYSEEKKYSGGETE